MSKSSKRDGWKKRDRRQKMLDSLADLRRERVLEKTLVDVQRLMASKRFSTQREVEEFIYDTLELNQIPSLPSLSDLERAQDMVYEAWGTSNWKSRVEMAQMALKMSRNRADAYVLLAKENSTGLENTLELFEEGTRAGERALGEEMFEDSRGHFWGITETRPYMRARSGLAMTLILLYRRDEAQKHLEGLIELNPDDNRGNRYLLLNILLERGSVNDAKRLLSDFKEDASADWAYGRALLDFPKYGAGRRSRRSLVEAMARNPSVPLYLLGLKQHLGSTKDYFSPGDEGGAYSYSNLAFGAWHEAEGALDWLLRNMQDLAKEYGND